MNEFRVLNDKGDIEVKILKQANAVFQTDEFLVDSTITVYKNTFNIFDLVFENKQLKAQIEEYQKALDETRFKKIDIENNWNKLKEWLKSNIKHWEEQEEKWDELGIIEVGRKSNIKIIFKMLLDIMQDLERSDSNV